MNQKEEADNKSESFYLWEVSLAAVRKTVEGVSDSHRDLGARLQEVSGALCALSSWALHRTAVPIAAALMWENTWLPWPRTPKWFKALTRGKTPSFHMPVVFGVPAAAGRAAPRAGSGASAAPRHCLARFVRIARQGLGMLREAQRGAGRNEAGPEKSLLLAPSAGSTSAPGSDLF